MDSEAEATIARRYCRFQNRKFPMIKPKVIPKQKNNIIKTKDSIVVSRPKGYNYIAKDCIPNDKIKLTVIEEPEKPINYEDIDPLYLAYLNMMRNGGRTRDYIKNPPGFANL